MAKNLVIVESPAKVKTIKKFLGKNYSVVASMGHVRDLPKSQMGIDIDNDFEPKYITIRGKGELLSELRKEAKKADTIYLATDPDREGEAISWHLRTALKLDGVDSKKKVERITFNEITKTAVKNSLKSPRDIDMNLVDAQQARRVLDRMVGYSISPLLWAKVKRGLSAGRVQSVALRIICERENEINAFIPEEYWTIEGKFAVKGEKKPLEAKFHGSLKEKLAIKTKDDADAIIKYCKKASYKVADVKNGERVRKAPLPFTTSTLQQEASSVLNFSTQKTMRIAQQLYEGIDVGSGTVGLISYLRTDSTRISEDAKEMAADYIEKNYGKEYLAAPNRKKSDAKKIQDAHEAIRPTDLDRSPTEIKDSLSRDQFRLYQLIWKRFIASQMAPARYATRNVKIQAGDKYIFTASASKIKFAGFMNVYTESGEEKSSGNVISGEISSDSEISCSEIEGKQHFTNPSPHYTEASLVKALEELGIGRPSTYAPIITTLLARRYITKEQKNIYVTEIGTAVDKILEEAFPGIVDVNFTANFETLLDGVEAGKVKWKTIIENFYPDLEKAVDKAEKEIEEVEIRDEVTDVICEECGRNMVVKYGPHGKFLGCPGFPECRNTKPYFEKIGVKCPKCGNEIVMRMTNKGRRFYGCLGYPECDFTSWPRPSKKKCPDCGGLMVEKGKKLVCINDECKKVIDREEEED
ncbi:type I DNA topoisomerase [Lachnospiraceae bacterium C1.1]|nr:type I DNA topoisomerase [Lachnospiraceae bacterium C1.1]